MADPALNLKLGVDDKPLSDGLRDSGKKIDEFGKKVRTASQGASVALSNLARVAQDAPFGFIAIANNLDPLISSLGNLSKTTGGVGGALKALGTALIGPAGLALAFSAVSSGITFAIQKYGSLGAAIDALFGRTNSLSQIVRDAAKSYEEFNKSARTAADIAREEAAGLQGQIVKVQQLAVIVGDQTKSYNERNTALKDLKSISKDYFGDLRIEKGLVVGLTSAVAAYVEAQVLSAKAKGFEKALGETTVQISDQETKLRQLGEARDAAIRAPQRFIGRADIVDTRAIQEATQAYREQEGIVNTLRGRSGELEGNLRTLTTQLNALKAKYKENDEEQNKVSETTQTSSKRTRDNTAEVERNRAALERQRRELELYEFLQDRIQTNQPQVSGAMTQLANILSKRGAQGGFEPLQQGFADPLSSAIQKSKQQITGFITSVDAARAASLGALKAQGEDIATVFGATLGPAIDGIFNALASGQDVIKNLGQVFKRLLVDIAATVIKTLALQAILAALTGGASAGVTAAVGGAASLLRGVTGAAGGLRGAAAPTFSGAAGINGGGIQLAGQVVFVQRGPDLVGVLNQGNARIGRVG